MKNKTVPILAALSALLIGGEIRLFTECSAMAEENAKLRSQNDQMASTIATMEDSNTLLSKNATEMQAENEDLREEVDLLVGKIDDMSLRMAYTTNMLTMLQEEYETVSTTIPERDYETDPENITEISGMSAEQFDEVIGKIMSSRGLTTCKLAGTGEAFEEVETTYGINGLYILAIFAHESAFATRCINTNNFGGIRANSGWKYFNTPSDCILYEGQLLKTKYVDVGLIDLDDIGAKYCESGAWPTRIQELVDEYTDIMTEVVE